MYRMNYSGISYNPSTNEALKLFTARYGKLKTNSSEAINMGTVVICSQLKYNSQKFPYENGIIKNYAVYIPGDQFDVGKTFSEGSKDVRNILKQKWDEITMTFAYMSKILSFDDTITVILDIFGFYCETQGLITLRHGLYKTV